MFSQSTGPRSQLYAKTRKPYSSIFPLLTRLNLSFKPHLASARRVDARMPRKLLILAATIVAAHVLQALVLGVSPVGVLVGNLLEVAASVLAAVVCFGAARRARGMARPFWALLACGMGVWGAANTAWMFYELVLHTAPEPGSPLRF